MKTRALILLMLVCSSLNSACAERQDAEQRALVEQLVRDQLNSWSLEDEEMFLSTIHPEIVFAYPGARLDRQGALDRLPIEAAEVGSVRAVDGVVEFLDGNFHKQLQLPELADRCGLSPRRFTDLFKERTGVTLTHYLNRRRIEYAQERLRETDQISYACHESGFRDVAYFYRVFKRHAGMTPGEYLARVRKEGREVA